MDKNIIEIIQNISKIPILNCTYNCKIIFHSKRWTDIFITNQLVSMNKKINKTLGELGLEELLYKSLPFPEHGQLEIEVKIENDLISNYKINKTYRIHKE